MPPPTLMIDFDGTVCLGDDPVRAYARAVASRVDDAVAARIDRGLAAYFSGSAEPYLDGYSAVMALSDGALSPIELGTCYLESREALARGELTVWAPPGLRDFLASLPVRRVLVTNAPDIGIRETLRALGLTDVVDDVVTGANKPNGLRALVPELLSEYTDPRSLLSVGDIWINDLAVPRELGCRTAYIDRFGVDHGPADATASTFENLYDFIAVWAAQCADPTTTKRTVS
ncbi:HAD family hydrolase [Actinomycetes bacterium M1A6_2h]